MVATSFSSRRIWWFPTVWTVAACVLVAIAFEAPEQDSVWLALAILGALPWSLALLLLDPLPGFAHRAGWVVAIGLLLNVAAVWGLTAVVKRRLDRGRTRESKADSR